MSAKLAHVRDRTLDQKGNVVQSKSLMHTLGVCTLTRSAKAHRKELPGAQPVQSSFGRRKVHCLASPHSSPLEALLSPSSVLLLSPSSVLLLSPSSVLWSPLQSDSMQYSPQTRRPIQHNPLPHNVANLCWICNNQQPLRSSARPGRFHQNTWRYVSQWHFHT